MNAYVVDNPTSRMPLYNVIHYHMFHGDAKRLGSVLPLPIPYFSSLDGFMPLEITRSGSFVPPVFAPLLSIVMSEQVKQQLEDLPGLAFLKVKFVKLIKEYIDKGNFDYPHDCPPDKILNRFPNVPELFNNIGSYYEAVYPILTHIFKTAPEDDEECPRLNLLSKDLLMRFPIIWDSKTILSEIAFRRIKSHLDKDFFEIYEVPISK